MNTRKQRQALLKTEEINMNTMQKVSNILVVAAHSFKTGEYTTYQQSVSVHFWKAFGLYEQSQLMQEVYITLCEMDFTPLESDQWI